MLNIFLRLLLRSSSFQNLHLLTGNVGCLAIRSCQLHYDWLRLFIAKSRWRMKRFTEIVWHVVRLNRDVSTAQSISKQQIINRSVVYRYKAPNPIWKLTVVLTKYFNSRSRIFLLSFRCHEM